MWHNDLVLIDKTNVENSKQKKIGILKSFLSRTCVRACVRTCIRTVSPGGPHPVYQSFPGDLSSPIPESFLTLSDMDSPVKIMYSLTSI